MAFHGVFKFFQVLLHRLLHFFLEENFGKGLQLLVDSFDLLLQGLFEVHHELLMDGASLPTPGELVHPGSHRIAMRLLELCLTDQSVALQPNCHFFPVTHDQEIHQSRQLLLPWLQLLPESLALLHLVSHTSEHCGK